MQINLIPDSSVSSAPAGFTAAVQAAANVFDQDFPGNYTVNITYGWGTFDNSPDSQLVGSEESLGGPDHGSYVGYSTVRGWLTSHATLNDQIAAYTSLPASSASLPGNPSSIYVSTAEQKALGVFSGNAGTVDGSIGFGTESFDWEGLALCEIGHALGWMTDYYAGAPTVLDLFRYASVGNRNWTGGQPAYFSIDGGKTNIANFSTTFDYTLFTNIAANDPFNVGGVSNSTLNLTSLDTEVLNIIGFGSQSVAARATDFNGAGKSDILWSNTNGDTAIWYATGSGGGFTSTDYGLIATSWQVVGTGDFNGNGDADLVWRNSNGDTNIWYANGSGGFTSSDLGIIPTSWQLSGTGDFSGDGLADVLWRNSNGDTNVWYSNGSGGFSSTDLGIVPTNWQIVGSGDFTGTGTDDIIWRNTANGDTNIWEPTGSGGFTSVDLGIVPTSWQIAGSGDFTGTGTDDILWRNTTNGDTAVWTPTGSGGFTSADLGIVPTSWQIAGLGDFNGNGTSDILWHNTTNGDTNIWSSNGSGGFTGADLGIVPTSWTVKAA